MTIIEQSTLFDYTALDAEARIVVQQRTSEIKTLMRRAAQDIIDIGQKLIEVKATLGYGRFGPWLEAEFEWNERTARRFIQVAEQFKTDKLSVLQIAPSALYLLAAPSTPDEAREEALNRAEAGERITHHTAKQIIADTVQRQCPYCGMQYMAACDAAGMTVCPSCHQGHAYSGARDIAKYGPYPGVHHVADVVQRHIAPPAIDDEPLDPYEEAIAAQCQARQPEPTVAPIHVAAASVEWYTPASYVDAARQVLRVIDLDPASSVVAQRRIQAQTWYGLDHPDPAQRNGLEAEWHGRVWLNPPYGVEGGKAVAAQWAAKLISDYDAGRVEEALLLVNAVIDSKWFDVLWRFPMCLTNHRIRFETTTEGVPTSPIIGSAFVYVGTRHVQAFVRAFTPFGAVVRRVTEEAL